MNFKIMKKLTFYLLLFFALVLTSFFLIGQIKINRQKIKAKNKISPTLTLKKGGKMWLVFKEKSVILNKPTSILVYSDSNNEPITGFDIVLKYDKNFWQFIKSSPLLEDYQIFKRINDDEIRITGIKKPESKVLTIFKETPLIQISFLPIKQGITEFNIVFSPNKTNESNLINENNQEILTDVKDLKINIK